MPSASLGELGADEVTHFVGSDVAEDAAAAVVEWSAGRSLWAVLGPSTAFGREVLGRMAAALRAGLVGDAIGLEIADGDLIAAKPAFSGALVADISCTSACPDGVGPTRGPGRASSPPTCRRGVGLADETAPSSAEWCHGGETTMSKCWPGPRWSSVSAPPCPRTSTRLLSPLAALLEAELAATRKVTDNGWAPRSRQVGITGRSIAPRLYVALGLSGKFNHVVGVRGAGTILAINRDPDALVFGHCDIGIVGDWHEVVLALVSAVRREHERQLVEARAGRPECTGPDGMDHHRA